MTWQQPIVPGPGGIFDGAYTPDDLSRPLYGATPKDAIVRFFKNYVRFSGRASRSEYWWVTLFVNLILLVLMLLMFPILFFVIIAIGSGSPMAFAAITIGGLFALVFVAFLFAIMIPTISLHWRRLQDTNRSGFLYFLIFVPYVGSLILLILAALQSDPAGRQYDSNLTVQYLPPAA